MRVAALLALAFACHRGPRRDDPIDTDVEEAGPTADTGAQVVPATIEARCVATTNALRFSCTVTVDPPQPVEIAFAPVDGSLGERVHGSDETVSDHTIDLYLMRPVADYAWTARPQRPQAIGEASGVVTTGGLPEGAQAVLNVSGTSTAPILGMASPCTDGAFVTLHDAATGAVLWFEDLSKGGFGYVEAASFTEDHTLLTLTDGHLLEVDLMGRTLLDVLDLPEQLHHDVFRRDGLTYVLFQESVSNAGANYLLDGFYVLDGGGAVVGEWHLFDSYQPTSAPPGPFPDDHSHANAIWVDAAGDVIVSFRHLSTFIKVDGLARPSFGEVRWRLAGEPGSELGTDFVLTNAVGTWPDFQQQHNVHVLPDGRIALLDNRSSVIERSRVLVLDVDEVAGTAVIAEDWGLPLHCDFQGSAWFTPAGNPTATCASYRQYWEVAVGGTEPSYEVEANCMQGIPQYVPRIVPLDW